MDLAWVSWAAVLERAERELADDLSNLDVVMADLPLELFGELLLAPPTRYSRLCGLLPRMPDEETQRAWTGDAGVSLVYKGTSFVRAALKYFSYRDVRVRGLTALDFGCGWGRLLRLFYKVFPVDQIEGVDPWDKSVAAFRACGLPSHVGLSDYLPSILPTHRASFDIVYAYSVFTHLSPRAFATCLATLRRSIAADGTLLLTTRPAEYWLQTGKPEAYETHLRDGFCYVPHPFRVIDGDSVYGDISVGVDYLRQFDEWRVEDVEVSHTDPLQVLVALRPVTGR